MWAQRRRGMGMRKAGNFVESASPHTTPRIRLHFQSPRPLQKQYVVTNHMVVSGISVTAKWAKPNRLGIATRVKAAKSPVTRSKSSVIHRYITVTSRAKNRAGAKR